MKRLAHRFRPVLDALDKKTLLSAGQLAHVASIHHHGGGKVSETSYYYYEKLTNNTGVNSLKVEWEYFLKPDAAVPAFKGSVTINNGATQLIGAGTSTNSQPGKFVAIFFAQKSRKTNTGNVASSTLKPVDYAKSAGSQLLQAVNLLPADPHHKSRR